MLRVLAFCTLAAGAFAQTNLSCTVGSPTTILARNEGKTELLGDYFFTCTNNTTGTLAAVVSVSLPSVPIASKILDTNTQTSEALVTETPVTGGNPAVFAGVYSAGPPAAINFQVTLAASASYTFEVSNIRADLTGLTAGTGVDEAITVTESGTPQALGNQQVAIVNLGLGPQSVTGAVNFPVCSTISGAAPAFTLNFGEGFPTAFKTQGSANNNFPGANLELNTETGFFTLVGNITNIANSGTRVRIVFNNVPANVSVYVPQTLVDISGQVATLTATTSENGVFTAATAAANPSGYTGPPLVAVAVSSGTGEAVYELTTDDQSVVQAYAAPVYLVSTGTVTSQPAAITATVSFAPVAAVANFPDFAQIGDSISVSGSQFPDCLSVSTSLPNGFTGVSYNQTINPTGGILPYRIFFSDVPNNILPPGLTLNSATGAISGIPTTAGSYPIYLLISDSGGQSLGQSYTITINPGVSITSATPPNPTFNSPYSFAPSATGGTGTYTWSISSGALPAGLTINSQTGAIAGTPTAAGAFSFTLQATDANNAQDTASVAYSFQVVYGLLQFDFPTYVDSLQPLAYFRLNANSGTRYAGSYSFTDSTTGATLTTPGAPITGTQVQATTLDGVSGQVTTTLSGGIATAATVMAWINLAQLPSVSGNTQYIAGESQNGNDFDLDFTTDNVLRFYTTSAGANLSFTPNPLSLAGQWHFVAATFDNGTGARAIYWDGVLVASDSTQSIPNKTGAFNIGESPVFTGRFFRGAIEEVAVWNKALTATQMQNLWWLSAVLPNAITNAPYPPVTLNANGGSGQYTYAATGLPPGIALSPTGQFSGTATSTGAFNTVMVTVTDSVTSSSTSQLFSMQVVAPVVISSALPSGDAGSAISAALQVTGGTGTPYFWTVAKGSLPAGVILDSTTGVLSGLPTTSGAYPITIQAADPVGNTGTLTGNIVINPALAIGTSLPDGDIGSLYNQAVGVTGGSGAYSFALTGGSLPGGLGLNPASGAVSGNPNQAGVFGFTVQVTDTANGATASQTVSLHINPMLLFGNPTLSSGQVGTPYSQSLAPTGGSGVYHIVVSSGALPAGLTLDASTGVVSGTPTQAVRGFMAFYLTDTASGQITTSFSFIVKAVPSLSTTSIPAAQQGTAYTTTLAATGGAGGPYTFNPATTLPAGLGLSTGGILSGTPTVSGAFTVGVSITDSANVTATANVPLVVSNQGTVITANLPVNTAIVNIGATQYGASTSSGPNQIYWQNPFTSNGSPLIEYTVQPGTYTFRAISPTDAVTAFPGLIPAQTAYMYTAWTYNTPWITSYLVFDASQPSGSNQIFSGAELPTTYSDAPSAYAAAISGRYFNEIFPGARNATPVTSYTFTAPTTLIFAIPDNGLSDNAGGMSVLVAPSAPNPLSITTTSLPGGTPLAPYTATLATAGGTGNFSWSTPTTLPSGLTFSSAGILSGTPSYTAANTSTPIQFTLTDLTSGATISTTLSLAIGPLPMTLSIGATPLPAGIVNVAYHGIVNATGAIGAVTWSLLSGTLPPGVIFNSDGTLTGAPTAAGSYTFTVQAVDTAMQTANQLFTVTVNPPLTFV
ncbi:MAG: putative Ig domain-containing protein, partial [Acidobacteriota bacterium]|nr:putative Ig domain-containing protein [Acidobacteriota bacterium]